MCSIIEIKNPSEYVIKYDTEDSIGNITKISNKIFYFCKRQTLEKCWNIVRLCICLFYSEFQSVNSFI